VAQARKHFCEKNDIPLADYNKQRKFFASLPENETLIRDGYILVAQDQPKEKE
jgi:hypothetical protein